MDRREFLTRLASYGAVGITVSGAGGCGTMLHPERVGQPHSHRVDWSIVALDGLGLILFFVPGVLAFAVDFWTGAIYLPYDAHYGWQGPSYRPTNYPPTQPGPPPLQEHLPPPPQVGPPHVAPPQVEPPQIAPPQVAPPQAALPSSALPPSQTDGSPASVPPPATPLGMRRVPIHRDKLNQQTIEQVVMYQSGKVVSLDDSSVRASQLAAIDKFASQCEEHRENPSFGQAARRFFQKLRRV